MTNTTTTIDKLIEEATELEISLIDNDFLQEIGLVYTTFDDEHFYYFKDEDNIDEENGIYSFDEVVNYYPELEEVIINALTNVINEEKELIHNHKETN